MAVGQAVEGVDHARLHLDEGLTAGETERRREASWTVRHSRQLARTRGVALARPVPEVALEQALSIRTRNPSREAMGLGRLHGPLQRRGVDGHGRPLASAAIRSAAASACGTALVGQVQSRGPPREHLSRWSACARGGRGSATAGAGERRGTGGNRTRSIVDAASRARPTGPGSTPGEERPARPRPGEPGAALVAGSCRRSQNRSSPAGLSPAGGLAGAGGAGAPGRLRRPGSTGVVPCPASAIPRARIAVVGLAPAAHGGQPDGAGLHRRPLGRLALRRPVPGRPGQPAHERRGRRRFGAHGAYVTAAVRCAPPQNKPTPQERTSASPISGASSPARRGPGRRRHSGQFAYQVVAGELGIRPRPGFGHGVEAVGARRPGRAVLVPPEPAEHLHRGAHRAHVRRRLRPGRDLASGRWASDEPRLRGAGAGIRRGASTAVAGQRRRLTRASLSQQLDGSRVVVTRPCLDGAVGEHAGHDLRGPGRCGRW